jgi:hypothetical protein
MLSTVQASGLKGNNLMMEATLSAGAANHEEGDHNQ